MMQTIYLKLNEALNATNTYSALYQVYGQSDEPSQERISQMVADAPVTQG
jgi:hypothetical protein